MESKSLARARSSRPSRVNGSAGPRRLRDNPVGALLGAGQVGETTLARETASNLKQVHHFDLERAPDLAWLSDPEVTLGPLRGLVDCLTYSDPRDHIQEREEA